MLTANVHIAISCEQESAVTVDSWITAKDAKLANAP
jgi:hypothetical protein